MPEITKNLLILNALFFLAASSFPDLNFYLALHPLSSDNFAPYQLVTHMFMHGNFMHILFNMFGVFMFGSSIEQVFGPKRYLFFYFFAGLGAAFLHAVVQHWQIVSATTQVELFAAMRPAVGASGAVFGLLAAFGILYPNRVIMLLFPPIPMKAKYFVLIFGALELYYGFQNAGSNVAHFAHLGGAIFGAGLIYYWRFRGQRF